MSTLITFIFIGISFCAVLISMVLFASLGISGLLLLGGVWVVTIGLAHVWFGRNDHYKRLFYGAVVGGAIPMLLITIAITMTDGGMIFVFFPIVLIPLLGIPMAIGVAITKQKQVHTSVVQSLLYVVVGYPAVFLVLVFTHMSYTTIRLASIHPYPNSQEVVFNVEHAWVPTFPNTQDFYSTTDSIEKVLQYYTDRNGLDCAIVGPRYNNEIGKNISYHIQCRSYRVLVQNEIPSSINRSKDTIVGECKDVEIVCTWIRLAAYTDSKVISSGAPWFYFDRRY